MGGRVRSRQRSCPTLTDPSECAMEGPSERLGFTRVLPQVKTSKPSLLRKDKNEASVKEVWTQSKSMSPISWLPTLAYRWPASNRPHRQASTTKWSNMTMIGVPIPDTKGHNTSESCGALKKPRQVHCRNLSRETPPPKTKVGPFVKGMVARPPCHKCIIQSLTLEIGR